MKYKTGKGREYQDIRWSELQGAVVSFALGLIKQGLKAGDRVALLSWNRLEWLVADLGTMMAGGVVVPICHTGTPDQCAHIIADSGARIAVIEDQVQLYKVRLKRLPDLETFIQMDGPVPESGGRIFSLAHIQEEGWAAQRRLTEELNSRRERLDRDRMATIVYTASPDGPPRGCMIGHGNIIRVLEAIDRTIDLDPKPNSGLLVLPLSHFYPRVSGYYYNLYKNIPMAIGRSPDAPAENLCEVRPTYFCGVPEIFENMRSKSISPAETVGKRGAALFHWALDVGRRMSRCLEDRLEPPYLLRKRHRLAEKLVLRKISDAFGGKLRFVVSAGAPLSTEVEDFFHALGIRVIVFYGLTETLGGAMTTFDRYRFGTVGKPMSGFKIDMAMDGEILIRGNNFPGYYNQPVMTAQILRDGWCHTGDVGRWDRDGFLIITGRKKDIIVTSGGRSVSPRNIENEIKTIPFISNAMVYGDGKKYLTALLTLDRAEIENMAGKRKIEDISRRSPVEDPEILALVQKRIDKINGKLARYETIECFKILPHEFSQERGEITQTLKVRRKVVSEKYRELLESMYRS